MNNSEKYPALLEMEKALDEAVKRLTGVSAKRLTKTKAIRKSVLKNIEVLLRNSELLPPEIASNLFSAKNLAYIENKWDKLWTFIRKEFQSVKEDIIKQLLKVAPEFHPLRSCPTGFYHVTQHPREVPISELHPDGYTTVREHCRRNPTHHDQMYSEEINRISTDHFKKSPQVCPDNLGFPHGSDYDAIIQGWTTYWNEVLKTEPPLDPNVVKALIASESGFNPHPKDQQTKGEGKARGIIQLTDGTIKTLANRKGELKDHLLHLSREDAYNPNIAICAGIRWLHQKHNLASKNLKRPATWEETIANYKGSLRAYKNAPDKMKLKDVGKFLKYYEKIKNCKGEK